MLTYEIIRDLERAERESKKLQKIPENIAEKTSPDITELENVRRVIKSFFELRTDKIIQLASDTVKTPNPLPPHNIAKREEGLFDKLVETMQIYREAFFREISSPVTGKKIMYRVRKSMPEFVGPDMNVYKLNENDIVNLPEPLNELLLKNGVIEQA